MASTYSDLKIELIGTGDQAGTWGATTNTNLGTAIEEAITGSADVDFVSNSDVTLNLTNTNISQPARNLRLRCYTSGSNITAARNLILGSGCQINKLYLVINDGLAYDITIKNTTGTGVTVAPNKSTFVFNDGTNVTEASTATPTIDLTTDVTGILPSANGGTNSAFFAVSGPTSVVRTYTFPDANTSVAGLTTTQTLTNKRVTPRVNGTTTDTTITPNGDTTDQYNVTALGSAAVFATPTGTPTNGQKLIIRIKDNGISRALTWSSVYRQIGNVLPAATTAGKTIYVGCVYNTEAGYWDVVAVAEEA